MIPLWWRHWWEHSRHGNWPTLQTRALLSSLESRLSNICRCRGPPHHLSLAKSFSQFLEAWLPVHTCVPHPLSGPDLWKRRWIRKKYRRHQMVNVSWWESRGDYCSVRKKHFVMKMAKAQIKTGSFQPALLGRWDRLKLQDAEKEEEQSVVVGRARWHVWAVQAPSGAHPRPLGDRGSGQADRSGWAARGKHLPSGGTESHRLQAPASLRKWQGTLPPWDWSPRQKRGMQRYLLLQNPSLIPGKEEKSTERAQWWGRTKRQGPEAMMRTMGRMDYFAVCSWARFVSTPGEMLDQLTDSMVCKTLKQGATLGASRGSLGRDQAGYC